MSNIMFFGDMPQLIDHGFSRAANTIDVHPTLPTQMLEMPQDREMLAFAWSPDLDFYLLRKTEMNYFYSQ